MHTSRIAKAIPSLLLSVLGVAAILELGACGSSSDSSSGTPDAGKDGPIWTAPGAIVSVSPAENDDNVSVHTPIQITYDEPVTVTSSSVTLSGPNSVAIATTLRLSDDGKTVTVTPVDGVPAPTKLTLRIDDIRTRDGAGAQTRSWSWTVPAWLRVGDSVASSVGGGFGLPAIAAGQGEQVYLAATDSAGQMVVRTLDNFRGKWSALGPLNGGRNNTILVDLVVDPNGAIFSSFVDGETGRIERWNATQWSASADLGRLGNGLTVALRSPTMTVDASGKLYVVYGSQPTDDQPSQLLVKSYTNGAWSQEGGVVLQTSENLSYAGIALSKGGVPHVYYNVGSQLFVSVLSSDKKTWNVLGGTINPSGQTIDTVAAIAVDDSDKPVVLACFGSIQFRRWDGGSWQTIGGPLPGRCGTFSARVARTASSHLFGLWRAEDFNLRAADLNGAVWTPVDLPRDPSARVDAADLAVDSAGRPNVEWMDGNGKIDVVRINR